MQLVNSNIKDIKMVVADLNNTLLGNEKQPSQRTLQMVDTLHKHDILFALTTSHSENITKQLASKLRPDLTIMCDGACAKKEAQLLYRATIPKILANEIISVLTNCNYLIDLTADSENNFFSMRQSTFIEYQQGYSNTIVTDFTKPLVTEGLLKITARLLNPKTAHKIIEQYPDVYLTEFNSERGYQFKSNRAKKHYALREVCNSLDIALGDIVAFGYDHNDIEMLNLVRTKGGCTIAVKNARQDCLDIAEFVCDDCENDGVSKWIEQNLFKLNL